MEWNFSASFDQNGNFRFSFSTPQGSKQTQASASEEEIWESFFDGIREMDIEDLHLSHRDLSTDDLRGWMEIYAGEEMFEAAAVLRDMILERAGEIVGDEEMEKIRRINNE